MNNKEIVNQEKKLISIFFCFETNKTFSQRTEAAEKSEKREETWFGCYCTEMK
jgi:hypothetical protein